MIKVQLDADGPITEMDEALLQKREGYLDNENEYTTWVEYRLPLQERVIHRSVHVTLKRPMVISEGLVGGFCG